MSEERCVFTACPGWGDHEFCALKTVVKDGKIDHTEKADYTGIEADEAFICQKGAVSWRQVYNPDRLLHPLKRIGERGEGKWEKISWDQALDEIAEKLLDIRQKYGNESVVGWALNASVPPAVGLENMLPLRLMALLEATDPLQAVGLDMGITYTQDVDMGAPQFGFVDPAVMEDADLILIWGCNPVENQMRVIRSVVEARSRGAKVYDIGLMFDGTAGYADWFIPVKPGSDTALALAIAKILIDDEACDYGFLKRRTVAPLLVNTETGQYQRADDGQYLAWDAAKGEPLRVAPMELDLPADVTLTGTYVIDGAECKPAFQMLADHVRAYTPEYCEEQTGVPAADVVDLARAIERSKTTFFLAALGMRYKNQGEIHRALTLLAALTGQIGKQGGGVSLGMMCTSWPIQFNAIDIAAPLGLNEKGFVKGPHFIRIDDFFEKAHKGEYKAFLKFEGNPVHNFPSRGRWLEALKHMELIVDYDVWMTDTGEMADYVLPDCMPFERDDLLNMGAYGHVVLQEAAIEPVGDNKPPSYFIPELAKRIGFGEYFQKTSDEWLEMMLKSDQLVNADGTPITLEQLRREKRVRPAVFPQAKFDPFTMSEYFPTKSGRLEFYNEDYAQLGEAMAVHRPSLTFPIAAGSEYPYQLFTGRQRFFMQSMFTDDPLMRELSGKKPMCRMNPLDIEREGLKTGDYIEVYNERGHVKLHLYGDEAVPPGTVHVWFGWRRKEFDEGMYSEMVVPCGGKEANDELSYYWWDQAINKRNGGMGSFVTGSLSINTGSWDTLFDCACAVRKAEERTVR